MAEIVKKKKDSMLVRKEALTGWLFLVPMIIGFVCFTAYPFFSAIYNSFCDYKLTSRVFTGFQNFKNLFMDEWFLRSLLNVLIYSLHVFVGTFLSLIVSALLVSTKKTSTFFRMVFYLPTLCGSVAVTFIWQWMLAPSYGILWKMLTNMGIKLAGTGFQFLTENNFLKSMMVMSIWSGAGISILMYYSTLKNISQSLYEAAEIDGANGINKFFSITLPSISPVTFYILITGVMGSLQVFTQFKVMKSQMAIYSMTPVWWIYLQTMQGEYGYASALGLVLGIIIILLTAVQFVVSKKWVHYDD